MKEWLSAAQPNCISHLFNLEDPCVRAQCRRGVPPWTHAPVFASVPNPSRRSRQVRAGRGRVWVTMTTLLLRVIKEQEDDAAMKPLLKVIR